MKRKRLNRVQLQEMIRRKFPTPRSLAEGAGISVQAAWSMMKKEDFMPKEETLARLGVDVVYEVREGE